MIAETCRNNFTNSNKVYVIVARTGEGAVQVQRSVASHRNQQSSPPLSRAQSRLHLVGVSELVCDKDVSRPEAMGESSAVSRRTCGTQLTLRIVCQSNHAHCAFSVGFSTANFGTATRLACRLRVGSEEEAL